MKKIAKLIGLLALVPAVILMTAWGTLAIYWSNPPPDLLRTVSAAVFGLATVLAFLCLANRFRTLIGFQEQDFVTFSIETRKIREGLPWLGR